MRALHAVDGLSTAFVPPALAAQRRAFVAGAASQPAAMRAAARAGHRAGAPPGARPACVQPRATAADVRVPAQNDGVTDNDGAAAAATAAFDDVVMHTYARYPLAMSHGRGARLYTVDGAEFLDFVAGIATCTLGHADERIIDAVTTQVRKLGHVSNLYYIPEQARLAKWLVDHSPADKVFFCNSGAEANEAAIKLVRKFWHQKKAAAAPADAIPVILTAVDSFHGRTLATITATGQPKYQAEFGPLVAGFEYVPYNDVEALEAAAARLGPRLAGVMLEALQGEGGVRPATVAFFKAARRVCDTVGALLVADEVQVGVGRTGRLWGFENLDTIPDVITAAKGLGGGVPIGAMLCAEHCNVFQPGSHASTFGGNPLAAAAALAVTTAVDKDGIVENCRARGEQLRAGLRSVAEKHPRMIDEVRGWGLINGVVLSEDSGVVAGDVVKAAMDQGLLLVPAGPTVVRFVPPLVVSEADVVLALRKFELALDALQK